MSVRIEWTRAMEALLGTMSDADVAGELGLGYQTVGNRRRKLEIPPYGRRGWSGSRNEIWTDESIDTIMRSVEVRAGRGLR